jgi:hypothetical protein
VEAPQTGPEIPPGLDVGNRPRPWIVIPCAIVLILAPLLAFLVRDIPLDALRFFVLAQAGCMAVLFSYAFYRALDRALRRAPLLSHELAKGHACGLAMQLLSLAIFIEFSVHRIGHHVLDWHTPFLQLLLWLMLLQWIWMERKNWRPLS